MSSFNDTQRSSRAGYDKKLRYRALIEDMTMIDDDVSTNMDNVVDRTSSTVMEAKNLLADFSMEEGVQNARVGYMDSKVLRKASHIAVKCSEAISGNIKTYDKHELAQHIREHPDFWSFTFPLEAPPVTFLYGTFDPTPPEQRPRAPRRQVQRQQAVEVKAPSNVDRIQRPEEGPQMVIKMKRFINKTYQKTQKPLSYFQTVLDPKSFSHTIENIYFVSFLVQDGYISVQIDEDIGLPIITPIPPQEKEDGEVTNKNQFVVSMDKKRWQEMLEAFNITTSINTFRR